MRIITPAAILRDWTPDDVLPLARHANNPDIAGHMRDAFPSPYTIQDARQFIAMALENTRALLLAIEVNGSAAGGIGIHVLPDVYRGTAEIGYWLSKDYQGKGIVTDAVRSIIPVAFDRFPIVRLQAGVFADNRASMRVLEKCGFGLEAIHRKAVTKNGVNMDEYLYVLVK